LRLTAVGGKYRCSNRECFEALALRHSCIQVQNAGTSYDGIGPQDDGRERISRLTIDPASMAPRLRPAAKRSKASPKKAAKAGTPKPGRGRTVVAIESDGAPIALVLIDDNRLLREGIVEMVRAQPGFKVLAASADAAEALKKVREAKPDIVLVDFGLEDHDSLSLTATVHAEVPEARVIVMGLLPMQEDVAHYVRAGASGFIMKDANFEEFFDTIRAVARGAQVLPSQLTNSLFSQIVRNAAVKSPARVQDAVRLTIRERQVIDLLGEGLSNKEIASRLHIAVHTVKSHVHNVLEKLALHSRLEVAAFSHASGGSKAFAR
jgi:DNA-binding NarL/FixJ family response regulator